MNGTLRCVGYVKPMDELPRITAVDTESQKIHIRSLAAMHGFCIEKIYCEESSDSAAEYMRLIDDAVHREFDVLIIDNLYCFGRTLFSAADLMENVLLPLGFRIYMASEGTDSGCPGFMRRLSYGKGCMRASLASVSQKNNQAAGVKSRRSKKQTAFKPMHDIAWYEGRQRELFGQMLSLPADFDELEGEMKYCRRAIKKLR